MHQLTPAASNIYILLVAHGDILRRITASPLGPGTLPWNNTEVRIFEFVNIEDEENCFLHQVEDDVAVAVGYDLTPMDELGHI